MVGVLDLCFLVGGIGACSDLVVAFIAGGLVQIDEVANGQLGVGELVCLPHQSSCGCIIGKGICSNCSNISFSIDAHLVSIGQDNLFQAGSRLDTVLVRIQFVFNYFDIELLIHTDTMGQFQNQAVVLVNQVGDGDVGSGLLDFLDNTCKDSRQFGNIILNELCVFAVSGVGGIYIDFIAILIQLFQTADLLQNSTFVGSFIHLNTNGVDLNTGLFHLIGIVLGIPGKFLQLIVGQCRTIVRIIRGSVAIDIGKAGSRLTVSNENHKLLTVITFFSSSTCENVMALLQSGSIVRAAVCLPFLNCTITTVTIVSSIGHGVIGSLSKCLQAMGTITIRVQRSGKGIDCNTVIIECAIFVNHKFCQGADNSILSRLNAIIMGTALVLIHRTGHINHNDNVNLTAGGVGNTGHGQLHLCDTGVAEVADCLSVLVDTDSALVGVLGEVGGAVVGGIIGTLGNRDVNGAGMLAVVGIGIGGGDGDDTLNTGEGQFTGLADGSNLAIGNRPGNGRILHGLGAIFGFIGNQRSQLQTCIDGSLPLDGDSGIAEHLLAVLGIDNVQIVVGSGGGNGDLVPDCIAILRIGHTDGGRTCDAGIGNQAIGFDGGNRLIGRSPCISTAGQSTLITGGSGPESLGQLLGLILGDKACVNAFHRVVRCGHSNTVGHSGSGDRCGIDLGIEVDLTCRGADGPGSAAGSQVTCVIGTTTAATGFIRHGQLVVSITPVDVLVVGITDHGQTCVVSTNSAAQIVAAVDQSHSAVGSGDSPLDIGGVFHLNGGDAVLVVLNNNSICSQAGAALHQGDAVAGSVGADDQVITGSNGICQLIDIGVVDNIIGRDGDSAVLLICLSIRDGVHIRYARFAAVNGSVTLVQCRCDISGSLESLGNIRRCSRCLNGCRRSRLFGGLCSKDVHGHHTHDHHEAQNQRHKTFCVAFPIHFYTSITNVRIYIGKTIYQRFFLVWPEEDCLTL